MNIDELKKLDKKYLWKPFTQMQEYLETEPLIIERGDGIYLYDIDGNKYIDGVSSLWVNTLGHNNQRLNNAVKKQIDKISHSTFLGLSNIPAILFAADLANILPKKLNKIFYSDNGSTACEIALKMAYQYCQQNKMKNRKYFVTLEQAYHGDTIGSVSLGGIDLFHKKYKNLLFKKYQVPAPYCYRCGLKLKYPDCGLACADKLEKTVKKNREKIIGVFMEPLVQGAAGMIVHPKGYLKRVEQICRKYSIFLILDEVATGFGRTGTMFACEQEKVKPDLMALAKGITGGYLPVAVTAAAQQIYNGFLGSFESGRTLYHGHTYTGNQLGTAAALEHLKIINNKRFFNKLNNNIKYFHKKLNRLYKLPNVGDIRKKGYMTGIELVKNKKTKEEFLYKDKIGYRVCEKAIKNGLWIRPLGNILVLMPMLITDKETLDLIVDIVYKSIKEVLIK